MTPSEEASEIRSEVQSLSEEANEIRSEVQSLREGPGRKYIKELRERVLLQPTTGHGEA